MNGNHHYLPQFYLNGFTGENERLYYCRKDYNTYRYTYPSGIYYKKGLNDIDLGEKGYFDLENDFFLKRDDRYGQAFKEMSEKYHYEINKIPLQVKADIVEFVLGLWWRVPGGLQHVIDLIEHEGIITPYYDKESHHVYYNKDVPSIIELMRKDHRYQKVLMPMVYEENINMHNWFELNDKFFIYETYEPLLIGDIPYVPLKTENKRGRILDEFMIPLDKNHILIYSKQHPKFLESNLFHFFLVCIVEGASKKIVCCDLEYLKSEITFAKEKMEGFHKLGISSIKDEMLAPLLEFESQYESFDKFKQFMDNKEYMNFVTPESIERFKKRFEV